MVVYSFSVFFQFKVNVFYIAPTFKYLFAEMKVIKYTEVHSSVRQPKPTLTGFVVWAMKATSVSVPLSIIPLAQETQP